VRATTGTLSLPATGVLGFFFAPVAGTPAVLTAGSRYFVVATCVGETGAGSYLAGGHKQNSVISDNGTFWFSNDPAGITFIGQNLTPELAFEVTLVGAGKAIPVASPLGVVWLIVMVALSGALELNRA
jgi:hypothetical protein